MTANGSPRQRHPVRRFAAVAFVVLLAVLSATGATGLLPAGGDVAVGGPLAVHPATGAGASTDQLPDDALPPPGLRSR